MAILNNLYPPIVDTYAPAFLIDSPDPSENICRIYFSISLYNVRADIKNAQVTVLSQNTNQSMLNEDKYPSNIMITSVETDRERETDDKYYIEIKKTDMKDQKFEINQYYKVQIRFTSIEAPDAQFNNGVQAIDSWLVANLRYFSEWSTICLVRGISSPILKIPNLESTTEYTIWKSSIIDLIGNLTFINGEEKEKLRSYRIKLYNDVGELLADSDTIYSNIYVGTNEINYTFKYALQDGEEYHIIIDYITQDLYEDSITYNLLVILGTLEKLNVELFPIFDEENGRIGLNIKGGPTDFVTGNFTIRRASSEDNFILWDDIYTTSIENQVINLTWYDSTIKSGVWYKYCVQKRDSLGNRGAVAQLEEPVMLEFEHIYLTTKDQQLNIKFNPQISSYKRTVAEAKTDTIGSKFPFIYRNGYMYYRQFPINGTISHFMDKDKLLTSREDIYKDNIELYNKYNEENRITPFNDYIYERDFREKVEEFLYKHNIKLFRSPTEGNILVKLMDINFTPEQTLSRMIYNFSCIAYEIADFTLENCNLYGIQSLGALEEELAYTEELHGQLQVTVPANIDVLNLLQEKYNKLMKEGFICNVEYLDFLNLNIESDPYLIKENVAGPAVVYDTQSSINPYPIDDTDDATPWDENPENAYLGYIAKINGQSIVISPQGVYELKGEDVRITSLTFPVPTSITIAYHTLISQTEDKSQLLNNIEYVRKVGQCWGSFDYKDSIGQMIWRKHYDKNLLAGYIQSLFSIDGINIEATPGTVVYVSESGESGFERFVIGDTCVLAFEDEDSIIEDLYFAGIHFEEATEDEKARDNMPDYRYVDTGISVTSLDDIENPIKNGVYTLTFPTTLSDEEDNRLEVLNKIYQSNNSSYDLLRMKSLNDKFATVLSEDLSSGKYIWYNDKWWLFTDSHDLLQPVEAIVNYNCEISKGWYQK